MSGASCSCNQSNSDTVTNNLKSIQSLPANPAVTNTYMQSDEYQNYIQNFAISPQINNAQIIMSNNNNTIQALAIPITSTNNERSSLVSFFQPGQTNFTSVVTSTIGNLANPSNFTGTFTVSDTTKNILFSSNFQNGKVTSTYTRPPNYNPGIEFQRVNPFLDCMSSCWAYLTNDLLWQITCYIFAPACLLACAIHCVLSGVIQQDPSYHNMSSYNMSSDAIQKNSSYHNMSSYNMSSDYIGSLRSNVPTVSAGSLRSNVPTVSTASVSVDKIPS